MMLAKIYIIYECIRQLACRVNKELCYSMVIYKCKRLFLYSFWLLLVSDDDFFNRNWAGASGGRWAGPGLWVGRGCRLLDRRGWGMTAATVLNRRLRV